MTIFSGRLEFLGDAVLDYLVSKYIVRTLSSVDNKKGKNSLTPGNYFDFYSIA